jgi:hypothetical protein
MIGCVFILSDPPAKKIRSIPFFICLAFALLALGARVGIHFISNNYNVSAEANSMLGVVHLAHGKVLYPSLDKPPYSIYLYGPFHAYLASFILKILSLTTLREEVLATRALSFFALIATLWIFWVGVAKKFKIVGWAYLLSMALGISKFCDYATTARADTVALGIEVLALVFMLAWIRRQKLRWLVACALACSLSFATRQSGVAVFLSVLIWFLGRRDYMRVFVFGAAVGGIFVAWFLLFQKLSSGAFYFHFILANIRAAKRIDLSLFDNSLLSFFATYWYFAALLIKGLRKVWGTDDPEMKFILIVEGWSFFLALAAFFRAGGDVNYFFEAILIGFVFSSIALKECGLRPLISVQLFFIGITFFIKSSYALQITRFPFEEASVRLQNGFEPFILVVGDYEPGLEIQLWELSVRGPDVREDGYIGPNAHSRVLSILREPDKMARSGALSAVVVAEGNCSRKDAYIRRIYKQYGPMEEWYPWLCVYPRKTAP